jgi:hypothetical protein
MTKLLLGSSTPSNLPDEVWPQCQLCGIRKKSVAWSKKAKALICRTCERKSK